MKGLLIALVSTAALASLTAACSGANDRVGEPASSEGMLTPSPDAPPSGGATAKGDPTPPAADPPAADPKPDASAPPPADPTCASTPNQQECTKCCMAQNDPRGDVRACACNAGAKCVDACGGNMCNSKLPSLECTLCLLQSRCEVSNWGDVRACLEQNQCDSKGR